MTSAIERKFFETFKIPKICKQGRTTCKQYNRSCDKCCYLQYPEITEHHYLKLIWLLSKVHVRPITPNFEFYSVMDVKVEILNNCIDAHDFADPDKFIKQVRELFKEE